MGFFVAKEPHLALSQESCMGNNKKRAADLLLRKKGKKKNQSPFLLAEKGARFPAI